MYTVIVLLLLSALCVVAYLLYLKAKSEKLLKITEGICPECDEKSIVVKRSKSGGCSGTMSVVYKCEKCGFEEDFNVNSGSCSGSCRM
ncbi:hypothetical protein [Nitrosophilus alvini]|uniref:hypothetical protein n=1 Tax=Nitrosophilus alvini TaxID=2714855 RepID=UPI00190A21E6|nr:hypothetical protein [Nitrosophilus alvini]